MLKKIAYFLRNLQTSPTDNSTILGIKDAKFSGYCFYINTNIGRDFKICTSVPLKYPFLKYFLRQHNIFDQITKIDLQITCETYKNFVNVRL